jgi:DNA-damage-inducible protein J
MALKSAFIRARTEPDLKESAEAILGDLGLSPTTVINMLYRQIVKRRAVPFEVGSPNAKTIRAMRDARSGRGVKRHASVEALFEEHGR